MIGQAVLSSKFSAGLHDLPPVEADPADWAEQQQAVALPDDEYPHLGGDRRVLITGSPVFDGD